MSSYGRLSIKGSSKLETSLSLILDNIAKDIKKHIDDDLYEAVVLIGGYGRGEGGVVVVDNIEYPHNNFDFVVISKNISNEQKDLLEIELSRIFSKHTKDINIEVEFSIVNSDKLKNHQPLVITYDMKYGHKLIVGDASVLKDNKNFELETIPAWDIRNLMVNRGTLLVINDLMLEKDVLSEKEKKIIIKHLVKAIIGYGDALLYHLGDYHFSYVQKEKLMKKQKNVNPVFKKMYQDAMKFRFFPNYEKYLNLNLYYLQDKIKKQLENIHILCDRLYLKNNDLNWKNYFDTTLNHSLCEDKSIKGVLKKVYNLTKNTPYINSIDIVQNIKIKLVGIKTIMPILFPYIAFDLKYQKLQNIMDEFFIIDNKEDIYRFKCGYLSYWKKYINSNFVKEDYGLEERVL